MRLSNLHQNKRRMCTMWVCCCFLLVCIFWRFIQVPDYSVLWFSFSETKGVGQTLRHADMPCWTDRIRWCTAHQNDWPMSSFSPWYQNCPFGKGKGENNHKKKMNGMHTIEERGGEYSRYLTVQELFWELTPLLSLMCIPLCFSVQPFYLLFPGKHLYLPLP